MADLLGAKRSICAFKQIGELVLFPTIRNVGSGIWFAASGASRCHQIKDATGHIVCPPAQTRLARLDLDQFQPRAAHSCDP